jgi:sugar phosphate isomerase/epimerase
MDRRDFLKTSALTLAGAIVGGSIISGLAGSAGCTPTPKNKRIGLQLWSVRELMNQDPEGTLKKLAEIGYSELETASYQDGKIYGLAPADFRALADKYGLKVTSCHIGRGWDPEKEEEIMAWWAAAIADHKALGCKYIVVPSIRFGETIESVDAICGYFNRVAQMVKEAGLSFGYHNHNFEFKEMDGQIPYDYMLAHTSADVFFEMDVYWVKAGGQDPVDYLKKYAGRFTVLHIKDDDIIGDSGKIDFAPIFEAAYAQGMKDFYVEVERYPLPAEICVEKSFDFLNAAPYVK